MLKSLNRKQIPTKAISVSWQIVFSRFAVEYSGKSQGSEKKKRRAKKTEDVEPSDDDGDSSDADDVSDDAKDALQSMDLKKDVSKGALLFLGDAPLHSTESSKHFGVEPERVVDMLTFCYSRTNTRAYS